MRQKACTSTNEPLVTTGRRADSGKAFQGLHVCNESSTCTKDTLESACFPLEAFSDSELSHDQRSIISEKSPFHSLTLQKEVLSVIACLRQLANAGDCGTEPERRPPKVLLRRPRYEGTISAAWDSTFNFMDGLGLPYSASSHALSYGCVQPMRVLSSKTSTDFC
jgi:hypothetical protein